MSLPAFLIAPDKNFQLFAGVGHLVCWLVVMPFLADALLGMARRMSEPLAAWEESGFTVAKVFFASMSFAGALFGAALLSIFFLAQSGLVKSPWE